MANSGAAAVAIVASRGWLVSVVLSVASIGLTVGLAPLDSESPAVWMLLEPIGLAVLVAVMARWARVGAVAAMLAPMIAFSMLVLRYLPASTASWPSGAVAVGLWAGAASVLAAWGTAFRLLARAREAAAEATAQRQQLAVAHDLHDYVAHDISEVVALAQSARFATREDQPKLLEQIEQAGQRSLASLDRTVGALRGNMQDIHTPDLSVLRALVHRFDHTPGPALQMAGDWATFDACPASVRSLVARTVTESLTNLRRHSDPTTTVVLAIARRDDHLIVDVTDAGPRFHAHGPASGLAALEARARDAGGSLRWGPEGDGWRVSLTLPLHGSGK